MKAALGAMLPGAAYMLLGYLNRRARGGGMQGDESGLQGA